MTPSRRLNNLIELFDNLEKTTADPSGIEVLVKLDDDQEGVKEFIEAEVTKRSFSIKYIITPRLEGVFSVWVGMEQLFRMADPDSYFITIISDEPRFTTQGWDNQLRKYMGFFKDDVFRLRLSKVKFANYAAHYDCTFKPDSFPIYTRKWLELTEGTGNCWGSDAYQQCIAFQLSLGPGGYNNIYREGGICRDVVVYDIEMEGLDFGVGVSAAEQKKRHKRNLKEWSRLSSYYMQERFSYLARRINCYIWAREHHIEQFKLINCKNRKTVLLVDKNNKKLLELSYALPRIVVYAQNAYRWMLLLPRKLANMCLTVIRLPVKEISRNNDVKLNEIIPNGYNSNTLKKRLKRTVNNLKIMAWVPINVISRRIDQLLAQSPPGISDKQSKWLKQEMQHQQQYQASLSEKTFI